MGVGKLVEFYGDGDQRPFRGDWEGGTDRQLRWGVAYPNAMEVSQKRSLLMKPVSAGIQEKSLRK